MKAKPVELVEAQPVKRKKVAIVGFAPSWKEAPFDSKSEDCEIWVLNEFYKVAPQIKNFRVDRWFEIHDLESPSKNKPEHIDFLRQCPVPLYLQEKFVSAEYPNAIPFPLDDIIKWMEGKGFKGSRYFTNSIAYFVMLAAYEQFEKISIFGVDMSTDSEYFHQKASAEYMIALCEGMGIEVFIPESSELLKCNQLYAFATSNKLRHWVKAQDKALGDRAKSFQQQEHQAQQAVLQAQIAQAEIRGAKSAYKEWLKRSQ
jgi:hypothetical protein